MVKFSEKLNDKWFRLAGIPLVALVSNVIFYGNQGRVHQISFGVQYIHSVLHAWILWETARQMIIWTRNRYSSFAESGKRIRYTLISVVLTTIVVMVAICAFYDLTNFWGYSLDYRRYIYNVSVALMYAVIVGGIYEAIYFFHKWREAFVEAEALKQANLQSQLDSLKSQINPHFLFNSLSSLSCLIADDSERAEKFVDELAAVYRYLLKTNEKELTTLSKELKFIQAYYHLLKTRFGRGILLEIEVENNCLEYLLPPLTLQILVENAVKHNSILADHPLVIRIYTESDNLVVVNNVQKKHSLIESDKTGLSNIVAKYRLLKQRRINIRQTEGKFEVIIPLIRQESYSFIEQ
jgi:sensor histidine kinase YesM